MSLRCCATPARDDEPGFRVDVCVVLAVTYELRWAPCPRLREARSICRPSHAAYSPITVPHIQGLGVETGVNSHSLAGYAAKRLIYAAGALQLEGVAAAAEAARYATFSGMPFGNSVCTRHPS
jgi:hypothetical protein